ncbi:hypothetical protein [Arsenophonus sp.]|uniref:hypothetical protein n=1 Tax=Arsenophonus sp. TaxID=1872640 RepID=UPI00387A6A02
MDKIICLLLSLTLAGCATYKKTYAPDGREAFSIDCSGLASNWGACLSKAGELCSTKGYDMLTNVSDAGHSSTLMGNSNADANAIRASSQSNVMAMSGSVINRNLLITCK